MGRCSLLRPPWIHYTSRNLRESHLVTTSPPRAIHHGAAPLRDDAAKFRAVFNAGLDARFVLDEGGVCLDANVAVAMVLGVEASAIVGASFRDLLEPTARQVFDALWAGRNHSALQEATLTLHDPTGTQRTFEAQLIARVQPGQHMVVMRDVTERELARNRASLDERVASLETLASGMAHEINNPLMVIFTSLDFLSNAVDDLHAHGDALPPGLDLAELRREIAAARRGADKVHAVVQALVAFTRSGGDDRATINLKVPLEAAIRLTENTIRHRAVLVREFTRVPRVYASESRLTQVFVHLLLNAAQAIPEKAVRQNQVRVALKRAPDGRALIEVHDTGTGMPPEVLARVFDPYFTTRPQGEGHGLGLSFCHSVVTSMGGEIRAESSAGVGSVFRVYLPVMDFLSVSSTPVPALRTAPPQRGRVLVIDDDALVCRSLQRLVSPHHDVVATTSGRDALDRIAKGDTFDAILCDVMMPEMSGIEVFQEIRARSPDLARRVVFVTGGVFSPEARSFLDAGAYTVLSKPVTSTALLQALERLID